MKGKIVFLGFIGILVLVLAASGCTSNTGNTTTSGNVDPKTDIVLDQMPLNFQANGPAGEWLVTDNFHSVSGTSYSQMSYKITMTDSQGKVLGSGIGTVNDALNANQPTGYFQIVVKNVKGTPTNATFTVISATKSTQ